MYLMILWSWHVPLTNANVNTTKQNMIWYIYQSMQSCKRRKLLVTASKNSLCEITFICDRVIIKFCKGRVWAPPSSVHNLMNRYISSFSGWRCCTPSAMGFEHWSIDSCILHSLSNPSRYCVLRGRSTRCYITNQQLLCAFSMRGCPFNIGCQKFNNTKSFIHIITGKSDRE